MNVNRPTASRHARGHNLEQVPALVIVGPVECECDQSSFFDHFPWRVRRVADRSHFVQLAIETRPHVVICERHLQDGDWRDVLTVLTSFQNLWPLVVTSRLADEYLWAEVLNLGGYDVLAKPLDVSEVCWTVNRAWEAAISDQGARGQIATASTAPQLHQFSATA